MRVVLPMESSQQFLQNRVAQMLGRSVQIGSVGLGWTHFKLDQVRIESALPSAEKSLISVQQVRAYWSFWALLRGKIKIDSVSIKKPTLHLVRYEDGTWNISDWMGEQSAESKEPEEEKNFGVDIYVKNFTLTNGELLFTDLLEKQTIEISKLYLGTEHVQMESPFSIRLNSDISYTPAEKEVQLFQVGLLAQLDLKSLNQEEMAVKIQSLLLTHAGGKFELKGNFNNVVAPHFWAELTGQDLSDKLVTWAAQDVPTFFIPKIQLKTEAVSDLTKHQVTVSSFDLQGLGSFVSGKGSAILGKEPVFSADGTFDFDLESIGQIAEMLANYRLTGHLQGSIKGTQQDVSAEVNSVAVGAKVPGAGNLSDIHFTLTVPDKDHASLENLTGKINGGEFTGNLTVAQTKRGIEIDLKASAPRVALPPLAQQPEPVEDDVPRLPQASSETAKLPPFYVKAAIDINSLDAPFIYGENFAFRANLKKLTSDLDQAQGTLSLSVNRGEIKDLAQLTSANILTGVLFGSLDVVGRVINSLNVLSVLDVFSGKEEGEDRSDDMVVQTIVDENGEEQHILVPYEPGSYADIWKFKSFATNMTFSDGTGDITKGLFRSDRVSFNLTGKMNFNTRGLNMNVQAAPGLHEEDGVMPLSLHIGGTMEEPKGSMKLLSSVTSVLTQSVANNFASRTVKKGVGSVVGLFKKKENPEETDSTEEDISEE